MRRRGLSRESWKITSNLLLLQEVNLMEVDKLISRSLTILVVLLAVAFLSVGLTYGQGPVGTAISYQGRLTDGGTAANGAYDFEFKLFNTTAAGTQQGSTYTRNDVTVTNGLFVVTLDFGAGVFNSQARYLEI